MRSTFPLAGAGLVLGAALGAVVGLLSAGSLGLLIGAGIGTSLGLVGGAALDALRSDRDAAN